MTTKHTAGGRWGQTTVPRLGRSRYAVHMTKQRKHSAVEAEIARERAEALGQSGTRLRAALDALSAFDAGARGRKTRATLITEAAQACLGYLVQREAMGLGMHDAQAARREFKVPEEVWNAMGAVERH